MASKLAAQKKRTTGGFLCPKCKTSTTACTDTRARNDGKVRRRRECVTCGHRFSTIEVEIPDGVHNLSPSLTWRDVPVTMEFLAHLFDAFSGADGHNLVVSIATGDIVKSVAAGRFHAATDTGTKCAG